MKRDSSLTDHQKGPGRKMIADQLPPPPRKIYIVNCYGPNLGDLAIIISMLATLKEKFPAAEFSIAAVGPEMITNYAGDAKVVRSTGSRSSKVRGQSIAFFALLRNRIWLYCRNKGVDLFFIAGKETRRSLREYLDADLIISCGGGYLNDNYGPASLGCLWDIHLGNLLHKPVVLYALSIGPYRSRFLKAVAGHVLDRVSLIICRNDISLQTLREMGVKRPAVYETADIAIVLPPAEKRRAEAILGAEGISDTSRLVTVTVTAWPFPGTADYGQKREQYLSALGALLDYAARKYGATILFVPMDVHYDLPEPGKPGLRARVIARGRKLRRWFLNRLSVDELEGMRQVCGQIHGDNVKILEGHYSPGETKAIIGMSRIHLATRMHSSIFAAASGTPILGIAYEPKMAAFLKTLKQDPFTLDIADLDHSDLVRRFDALWENNERSRQIIREETERVQRAAGLNAGLVLTAFNRWSGKQ
jgi:polysaccharide pyruvyl transferase WcaK-like protein